jgi:predicted DNA-binding transcriptional regulator AlpA
MIPTWLEELRSVPVIKPKRWSELSGMPRSTVYDAIANESLPSVRIGQAIWIPTEPLLRLLGADVEEAA